MSIFQFLIILRFPPGGASFALYPQHTTFCRVKGQLPGDILQKQAVQWANRLSFLRIDFYQKVFDFWRKFMPIMQILYIDYNFRPNSS